MKPKRVQRKRTKGFKLPAGTIVCTRPTIWGNPFVGPDAVAAFRALLAGKLFIYGCTEKHEVGGEDGHPTELVECNGAVFVVDNKQLEVNSEWSYFPGCSYESQANTILSRIGELRGKDLACFCALDHACHVDVLLEIANR